MKIIRGIHNLNKSNTNSVVTIGNFDGIHLGHQKLFFYTQKIGIQNNISTIIVLFEPQPLEFLKKDDAPVRITTFRQKIKHILSYNIKKILCIRFNKKFQFLSPEDFIINILINKLRMKFIVIGDDFKFGFQKSGNVNILKKLGNKYKFNVVQVKSLYKNNIKVSSTNIRKALSKNNIKLASLLMGRPFSVFGRVVYGNSIGKKLGYPTANIFLNKNFSLNNGVYAVKVCHCSKKTFLGISNIGIKPSFNNIQKDRILEVYLFDINIDLYKKNIEVFIFKKIRDEHKFSSKEKLKKQIFKDIIIVKKYFKIF